MDCSPYSAVETPFTASRPSPATDARRCNHHWGQERCLLLNRRSFWGTYGYSHATDGSLP